MNARRYAGNHLVGMKRVESRSHCKWHVDGGATNGLWRVVADCGALAAPTMNRGGVADEVRSRESAAGSRVQVQIEEIPDAGPCIALLRRVLRFARHRRHAAIEHVPAGGIVVDLHVRQVGLS